MQPPHFIETLHDGTSFKMIFVEGGTFDMGGEDRHKVTVPPFFIGEFPVTHAVWKAVMNGNNPSRFKGDRRPVKSISWDKTKEFIKALQKTTCKAYRLPSEAEWEYAARGGNKSEGYEYAGSNKLKEVGWYYENSYGQTKPVGLKFPNELGLYDMSGNVWEWYEDDWHDSDSYNWAPENGSAWIDSPERGVDRVCRGGSFFLNNKYCRSTSRFYWNPGHGFKLLGFRVVVPSQSVG
jgi:formylglycine-generating enzyme required for sulfatase activity